EESGSDDEQQQRESDTLRGDPRRPGREEARNPPAQQVQSRVARAARAPSHEEADRDKGQADRRGSPANPQSERYRQIVALTEAMRGVRAAADGGQGSAEGAACEQAPTLVSRGEAHRGRTSRYPMTFPPPG